MSSNEE